MITLTSEGRTVLRNVAQGKSAWLGWDAQHPAKTGEGQDAYAARAKAIADCRTAALIDDLNLITDQGRAVIRALECGHV